MDSDPNQIPPERQFAYYFGMILTGIGILLFLSNFFVDHSPSFSHESFPSSSHQFRSSWDSMSSRQDSMMARALGGMALIVIGSVISGIGAKGWAGSGIVLDPEQQRKDMEPWSRMTGGMIQDAISEIEVVKKLEQRLDPPAPVVKVRCRKCQSLNDETARFCNQCGSMV